MRVDRPLDLGTPSRNSFVDDGVVVAHLRVADSVGVPKALEWVLDLRDGRRVLVPGLNPGGLFSSTWEEYGGK